MFSVAASDGLFWKKQIQENFPFHKEMENTSNYDVIRS